MPSDDYVLISLQSWGGGALIVHIKFFFFKMRHFPHTTSGALLSAPFELQNLIHVVINISAPKNPQLHGSG